VTKISKALKRTVGALRQKARHLGIAIGHRQQPKRRSRRGWRDQDDGCAVPSAVAGLR